MYTACVMNAPQPVYLSLKFLALPKTAILSMSLALTSFTTKPFFRKKVYSLNKVNISIGYKGVIAKKIIKRMRFIHIVYRVSLFRDVKNQWVTIPATCPQAPLARCNTANRLRNFRHKNIMIISIAKAICSGNNFSLAEFWTYQHKVNLLLLILCQCYSSLGGGLSRAIEWWKVHFIFWWDRFQSRDKAPRQTQFARVGDNQR